MITVLSFHGAILHYRTILMSLYPTNPQSYEGGLMFSSISLVNLKDLYLAREKEGRCWDRMGWRIIKHHGLAIDRVSVMIQCDVGCLFSLSPGSTVTIPLALYRC